RREHLCERRCEARPRAIHPVSQEDRIARCLLAVASGDHHLQITAPIRSRAAEGSSDDLRRFVGFTFEICRAQRQLLRARASRIDGRPLFDRVLAGSIEDERHDTRCAPTKASLLELVAPTYDLLIEKLLDFVPARPSERRLVPELSLKGKPRGEGKRFGP